MAKFTSIQLLVSVIFCLRVINCWVVTEIPYNQLAPFMDEDSEDDDDEQNLLPEKNTDLRISLIFPGTKWCGAGNVADNYDDLGIAKKTDRCCREHDHCSEVMAAGETKYNLTNSAFYSRLSCDCDETFRKCLRNTKSKTSRIVGTVYFNLLGTKCYRNDYPVIGCKKRCGIIKKKCLEYDYDYLGQQHYQWFDVPRY